MYLLLRRYSTWWHAAFTGYPIWMLLAGPRHVVGPPHSVHSLAAYADNAVGPIVPASNQLVNPPGSAQLTKAALLHDPTESGVYLGAPLLQSIEPARFSLFVQLSAALVLGLAVLVLLPLLPRLPYQPVRIGAPGFFASLAAEVIPSGAVALTYPWSARPNDDAMFWQIASGMRFKLLGGDVFVPGEHGISVGYVRPPGSTAVQHLLLEGAKKGHDIAYRFTRGLHCWRTWRDKVPSEMIWSSRDFHCLGSCPMALTGAS